MYFYALTHHCKSDISDLRGVINNGIESIHQVLRLCGLDNL